MGQCLVLWASAVVSVYLIEHIEEINSILMYHKLGWNKEGCWDAWACPGRQ